MTAQPYQPATDRPATDEQEADGHATDEDEAGSLHAASPGYEPAHGAGSGAGQFGATQPGDPDLVVVPEDAVADPATASTAAASPLTAGMQPAGLGQQWHDIQATFVDDPQGSVQRAAAAAGAAVSALADILRQRQAALTPAGGDSADTEQLREALRSYRIFCQNLADVGQQLRQPRP